MIASRLAFGRPQHAADHLAIQAHLFRWPGQNAAADLGHVPAFGQHHAVGDDLDLAGGEAGERRVALMLGRAAVDVFTAHAGLDELVADVDAVSYADGEDHGLPALAVLVPMRDDVADQLWAIHPLGEFCLDVVTGLCPERLRDRD